MGMNSTFVQHNYDRFHRLLVLLTFWPEARMHSGISSSSYDVQELLLEIAEDVVDSALLSIEQQR